MRRVHLIIMMLVAATTVAAQDTVRLSLDSCLHYAYKHNLSVLTAELGEERAEATLDGAKMNFLPSLRADASAGVAWSDGRTRSGNYGLRASLPIFDGFNNVHNLKYAQAGIEQSELILRQTRNDVGAKIVSYYLAIAMNEEMLEYQLELLESTELLKLEGEQKLADGKIMESEYNLLEANYLSILTLIENTRINIESNRSTLTKIMGLVEKVDNKRSILKRKPQVVWTAMRDRWFVAPDVSLPSADTVMDRSMRSMPEWRLNDIDVEMAHIKVELARSAMLPILSLNAALGGQFLPDRPNDDSFLAAASVSLGLSVPIFDRGSTITEFKKSKIDLREAELRRSQRYLDLRKAVEDLYNEVQRSLNSYRAAESMSQAYHRTYEEYAIAFGEDRVSVVELLMQQGKYLNALNEWLEEKYTYILTRKQMEINTGE